MRKKKAEIKAKAREKGRKTKGNQKNREGKNRAANQMTKEMQKIVKTGQQTEKRKTSKTRQEKRGQQARNRENQGANERTKRGKFVDPGHQMCFLNFVDGGKEKLLLLCLFLGLGNAQKDLQNEGVRWKKPLVHEEELDLKLVLHP